MGAAGLFITWARPTESLPSDGILSFGRTVEVFFFFQAEDGIRDLTVTGVQTCALPISTARTSTNGTAVPCMARSLNLSGSGSLAPRGPGLQRVPMGDISVIPQAWTMRRPYLFSNPSIIDCGAADPPTIIVCSVFRFHLPGLQSSTPLGCPVVPEV